MRIEDSISGFGHAIGEMFGPTLQEFEDNIPGAKAVMVLTMSRPSPDGKVSQIVATLKPDGDGITDVHVSLKKIEPDEPEPESGAGQIEPIHCTCDECIATLG